MNGRRFEIFRILGFPIRIDLSWIIILVLVTYSLAVGYFPASHPGMPTTAYWAMGFVAAIGLFLSILFHELSHSVMARHFKIKIEGITLFIFGGVAEMADESPSPKVEFWVALMGPLASILLAFLFIKSSSLAVQYQANQGLTLILYYLGFMNGLLAVFNLVPAFPLDGGRIFRSILWAIKKDYIWATRVSAALGQGFGWLLVAFGVFSFFQRNPLGGFWYILIGFFLKQASRGSFKQVLIQKRLEGLSLAQIMDPHFLKIHPHDLLEDLIPQLESNPLQTHYPVVESGNLVGFLLLEKLKELSQKPMAYHRAADLLDRDLGGATLGAEQDAWEAFQKMRRGGLNSLFVLEDGRLAGMVSLEKILSLAQPGIKEK